MAEVRSVCCYLISWAYCRWSNRCGFELKPLWEVGYYQPVLESNNTNQPATTLEKLCGDLGLLKSTREQLRIWKRCFNQPSRKPEVIPPYVFAPPPGPSKSQRTRQSILLLFGYLFFALISIFGSLLIRTVLDPPSKVAISPIIGTPVRSASCAEPSKATAFANPHHDSLCIWGLYD